MRLRQNGVVYGKRHRVPRDFTDVCKHASSTCDCGDEERLSVRAANQRPGECQGRGSVLRYGKSLAGYVGMSVRSGIDISDNKSETGTRWTVHSPGSGSEPRRPGNERESSGPGEEKQSWAKDVSYLCCNRAR